MKSAFRLSLLGALCVFVLALVQSCGSPAPSRSERRAITDRSPPATDVMRISVLRDAVIKNGLVSAESLEIAGDPERQRVGKLIFESPLMSFNSAISCRDCHLEQFGSTDGLPNAVGAGGSGHGAARLGSGGRIVPRNVLPLWGRGSLGFTTFFWDGRVSVVDGKVVSQFGDAAPSEDPFLVAVHLPSVELREMIADTSDARNRFVYESVASATAIHREIGARFSADPTIGPMLAHAYQIARSDLGFGQVSDALAQFIRHKFRIQSTPLHRFAFSDGPISEAQLRGGLLFYGRGRCSACHNGPYFSDFDFHGVAFPQAGFGPNGFGIDEGRYNATLDPDDRFLFRTPPLYNVSKTGPYSHSGSVAQLEEAIVAHFDPLRLVHTDSMDIESRSNFFLRLGVSGKETVPTALTDSEVRDLVIFLTMLDF